MSSVTQLFVLMTDGVQPVLKNLVLALEVHWCYSKDTLSFSAKKPCQKSRWKKKKLPVGARCQKEMSKKSKLVLFWSFSVNSFAMPRVKRKKQQKVQSDDLWIAAVSKCSRDQIDADNKEKVTCRLIELADGKLESLSSRIEGCKDKKLDFEVADIAVASRLFATFETGKGTLQHGETAEDVIAQKVDRKCLRALLKSGDSLSQLFLCLTALGLALGTLDRNASVSSPTR